MFKIDSTNKFSKELFSRGYILKENSKPLTPQHWSHGSFRAYHYSYDPRLSLERARNEHAELLIFGLICDVRRPKDSPAYHAKCLANALARSESEFFDALSFCCGRYVVVCAGSEGEEFVVTDATGMRSAFYCAGTSRVVTSHAGLLKENVPGAKLREAMPFKFGYPGVRCPVEDAFLLTPNTKLSLIDFSVMRFWPLTAIKKQGLDDATKKVHANMRGTVEFLEQHCQPLVSVTAGLDSRVTVSFFRHIKNAQYFTYFRNRNVDTDSLDRDFAVLLRDRYKRPVTIIETRKGTPVEPEFSAIQDLNTYYKHGKTVAWKYYCLFLSQPKAVHVRSNISEVGREFWGTESAPLSTGEDLARLYLCELTNNSPSYTCRVNELFEEFAQVTGILKCADLIDVKSLFYWEFRMASWHSQIVIESDPAFETISLFNCRDTLESLLSVTQAERKNSLIMRSLINTNWPQLTAHPVNGWPFWPASRWSWGVVQARFNSVLEKGRRALISKVRGNKWLKRVKDKRRSERECLAKLRSLP